MGTRRAFAATVDASVLSWVLRIQQPYLRVKK
jgi:hypothetical protein